MPTLQELLDGIDIDDEDFQDLQDLAEIFVSHLPPGLEADSAAGDCRDAKEESAEFKLSGPVVAESMLGSAKQPMESAQDSDRGRVKSPQSTNEHEILKPETYNMDKIFYDDEIPIVDDESLEIQDEAMDEVYMNFESSPADRLISTTPLSEYDPVDVDLESPLASISDCGYESQGSPIHEFTSLKDPQDEFNHLINELFPSLA